jgi:acetate kinase
MGLMRATGGARGDLRLITCHLGGGCSATAVRNGQPVATTMGFSPLEGLMMGSRCGSVDPGLLIYLQRECGFTVDRIDQALNYESGLAAVSGLGADLAAIEVAARHGNERAQLAFDMFTDRVRSAIGALAVSMGGVDALVFTDRIGENSPGFRTAVCQGLECLGVQLDPERNRVCQPDEDIAAPDSRARLLVIRTREEAMIAREAWRALRKPGRG